MTRIRASVTRIGGGLLAAGLAGMALVVVAPAPQSARAEGPLTDDIEVTADCSLAEAITIANAASLWNPGDGSQNGAPTEDCNGFNYPTQRIRITANSGTATNPASPSVTSPGVQLDPTVHAGADIAGGVTLLPTVTGSDVVIEGDPDHPAPNGYSIYVAEPDPSLAGPLPAGRILDVAQNAKLTLRNLNVGGGEVAPTTFAGYGAGAAVYARGALVVDHVTFLDNTVSGAGTGTGTATGGAIYAESTLTVRSSVFESNSVVGADHGVSTPTPRRPWMRPLPGADGGDALGGAVGLAPAATATVSDSVFLTNSARGGTGGPGSMGAGGSDGADGANGSCDSTAQYKATGSDGQSGGDGGDGGTGGDGGDAVGVIYGGTSLTIDHSAFLDSVAVAGAAGIGGIGGLGGDAGDGGKGQQCSASSTQTFGGAGWTGDGGNGGDGGDNGISGVPGAQGIAVATVTSAAGARGKDGQTDPDPGVDLTLVDVTVSGGSATVPADNFGTIDPQVWLDKRAIILIAHGGQGGAGGATEDPNPDTGGARTGLPGQDGDSGEGTGLLSREAAIRLGEAEVIGATGVQGSGAVSDLVDAQISFATFADVTVSAPTTAMIYRGGSRASAGFTFADTTVKGSVLWHAGSMGDPNMCTGAGSAGTGGTSITTGGYNVFDKNDCLVPVNHDVATSSRPITEGESYLGVVIRPANRPGDDYRMPELTLQKSSAARDLAPAPTSTSPVAHPCGVIGTVGQNLTDDARRAARPSPGTNCDAGAYEEQAANSQTIVTIEIPGQGENALYAGTSDTRDVVLRVPNDPGNGTTLVVDVTGLDDVDFPTLPLADANGVATGARVSFTPTANDAPGHREASIDLDTYQLAYPIGAAFQVAAPATSPNGSVTFTATILGVPPTDTTDAQASLSVVNDGQIGVGLSAPDIWSPCSGYLPITYTANSVGHSPAPATTVWLTPVIVQPNSTNGLPAVPAGRTTASDPPLVYPSAGTATVEGGGQVRWHTPAIPLGGAPPTLTLYIPIGVYPGTSVTYAPGTPLTITSQVRYDQGSTGLLIGAPAAQKSVTLTSDLDLLDGVLTTRNDGAGGNAVIAGQPSTLYAEINAAACGAPSAKLSRWPALKLTVRDPEAGTTLIDGLNTNNLAANGGQTRFRLDFTAPKTVGTHYLDFSFVSPDGEAVTRQVSYVVEPVRVSVSDAGTVAEGGSRSFHISLDHPIDVPVTVGWKAVSGTATEGSDFPAQSGTATIPAGVTGTAVLLRTTNDTEPESDETFYLVLSENTATPLPDGVAIGQGLGVATIVSDDFGISAADAFVMEGDSGTTDLVFTLHSDLPATTPCNLRVTTVLDGGASDGDLTPLDQVIPIGNSGGEPVTIPVTVPITGDRIDESDETFTLRLTGVLQDGVSACGVVDAGTDGNHDAIGTILDDDKATVSIEDTVQAENDSPASFPITVDAPAERDITVHVATAPGTAGAGRFTATSGDVTIYAGHTSAVFSVPLIDDQIDQPDDETFTATLTPGDDVLIGRSLATATIVDDDLPALLPSLTSSSTDLTPGQAVTLTASHYQPGETVEFVLHSDPVTLGTAMTDGHGTAIWTGTVPYDTAAGIHQLSVTGRTSGFVDTLDVTVTAGTTGSTVTSTSTGTGSTTGTGTSTATVSTSTGGTTGTGSTTGTGTSTGTGRSTVTGTSRSTGTPTRTATASTGTDSTTVTATSTATISTVTGTSTVAGTSTVTGSTGSLADTGLRLTGFALLAGLLLSTGLALAYRGRHRTGRRT